MVRHELTVAIFIPHFEDIPLKRTDVNMKYQHEIIKATYKKLMAMKKIFTLEYLKAIALAVLLAGAIGSLGMTLNASHNINSIILPALL